MILCRRPVVVHDVDAFGVLGVATLLVAAWLLVAVPWQRTWSGFGGAARRQSAAEAGLRRDLAALEQFENGLVRITTALDEQRALVPGPGAISRLLQNMTDVARAANLEILSVTPQPPGVDGPHQVNDISVTGRGRSTDFVRFLDQFAQENPYQTLRQCSITRTASAPDAACELAWSVRLYFLAPEPVRPAEVKP